MKYLIFIISIMVVIVIIAGCTTENNSIPIIENKLSILDPSEMALQLSDLPEGYVEVYSGSLNLGNNSEGLNATKQFIVEFQKGTTPNTFINQVILVFPIDQINKTIPYISSGSLKISTTKQLSNPNIGDSSFAIKAVNSLRGGYIHNLFREKGCVRSN